MFGPDVLAHLPHLRAEAESLLTDLCDIEERAGSTIDPESGQRVDVWAPVNAEPVPCRVRVSLAEQQVSAGGQDVTVVRATIAVPVSVEGLTTQQRIVPTTSADPLAQGRAFYITAIPYGTHLAVRRLSVSTEQG